MSKKLTVRKRAGDAGETAVFKAVVPNLNFGLEYDNRDPIASRVRSGGSGVWRRFRGIYNMLKLGNCGGFEWVLTGVTKGAGRHAESFEHEGECLIDVVSYNKVPTRLCCSSIRINGNSLLLVRFMTHLICSCWKCGYYSSYLELHLWLVFSLVGRLQEHCRDSSLGLF
jgi:hypothetical protein